MGCGSGVPCAKDLLKGRSAANTKKKPVNVAKTFAKSMKAWAKSGFALASRSDHAKRFAVCCACPELVGHICKKCTCLAFAKTKLGSEKCPIGKW